MYIKRDLYTAKETCIHQKRPMYIKRDLYTAKETYIHQNRPTINKRDQQTRVAVLPIVESVTDSSQETYVY